MPETISVTFKCLACGTDPVTLTTDDDVATDDSQVRCKNCGQDFGRYCDVKAKAREMAAASIKKATRDAFKKIGR